MIQEERAMLNEVAGQGLSVGLSLGVLVGIIAAIVIVVATVVVLLVVMRSRKKKARMAAMPPSPYPGSYASPRQAQPPAGFSQPPASTGLPPQPPDPTGSPQQPASPAYPHPSAPTGSPQQFAPPPPAHTQVPRQQFAPPPPGQEFSYFAFISYSRRDEHWAKWLQKKLEHYRLPTVLRKEAHTLPKKIHPIFRDKTDLTTGQLQTALHRELDASKKLIVICSPHSARSEWVSKEVRRFIELGRAGDIIPFIVEGIPNSGGATECFPPSLLLPEEEQLLGVSVPELGKGDSFLRVVAGLLGIKFDQLKRRHEQRKKRNNLIAGACALLFLVIAGFGGFKAWDYFVPHEHYYADYVLRWGVPEGIIELTKEEIAAREGHYTIITERGLIRTLIYANSAGTPIEITEPEVADRPMISLYYYTAEGQISHVEYVDNNGRVLSTQVYTTDLRAVDLQQSRSDSSLQTLEASTTSTISDLDPSLMYSQRSDIARYLLEYDERGYVIKRIYMQDRRTPILDADGIGGLAYTLDELGRPIEIRYLGLSGDSYTVTRKNLAGKRCYYDDRGNLRRVEYVDPQGQLCFNKDGWEALEITYDNQGNATRRAFLDADGELVTSRVGYACSVFGFDERGNNTSVEFFDVFGTPASFGGMWNEYDQNGRTIRQSYFHGNEDTSFATLVFEYDERGNCTSKMALGPQGELFVAGYGWAILRTEYDARGNITSESYYGVDGRPLLNSAGIASYRAEFDDHNNSIAAWFYGTDGQLTLSSDGYAIEKSEYDDRDNIISRSFFGTDEQPILWAGGYSSVEFTYNSSGNNVSTRMFGIHGEPVIAHTGFASTECEYDERGNLTRLKRLGLDGEMILGTYDCAGLAYEYDELGRITQLTFLGTDNKPAVATYKDVAIISLVYDERGNTVACAYYGVDGKPMLGNDGYAKVEVTYDVRGNSVGLYYYGIDGRPIEIPEGYAVKKPTFDERGRLTDIAFFDAEGTLLTRQVIKIRVHPADSAGLEALGVQAGDVFVRFGNWDYFQQDPGDFVAQANASTYSQATVHSDIYYSFLLEDSGSWGASITATLYRPSTGAFFTVVFGAHTGFDITEYFVSENFYQSMNTAWQQREGAHSGTG